MNAESSGGKAVEGSTFRVFRDMENSRSVTRSGRAYNFSPDGSNAKRRGDRIDEPVAKRAKLGERSAGDSSTVLIHNENVAADRELLIRENAAVASPINAILISEQGSGASDGTQTDDEGISRRVVRTRRGKQGEAFRAWAREIREFKGNSEIVQLARNLIEGKMSTRAIRYSNIHKLAIQRCREIKRKRTEVEENFGSPNERVGKFKMINKQFDRDPKSVVRKILKGESPPAVRLAGGPVAKFYKELYDSNRVNGDLSDYRRLGTGKTPLFTAEEVKRAIKRGTSAVGADRVDRNQIRSWMNRCSLEVLTFFNLLLLGRDLPDSLQIGKLTLIPKTVGKEAQVEHCRPITVLSELYRVYLKLLVDRLFPQVIGGKSKFQLGIATPSGSAIGATIVKRCVEIAHAKGKSIGLVSLDARKAFDRIERATIAEGIRDANVDPHLAECVIATLRHTSVAYTSKSGRKVTFSTKRGVPQGSPLSALMFTIGIRRALLEAQKTKRPFVDSGVKFAVTGYCDDICVVNSNLSEAVKTAERVAMQLESVGLELNVRKTQVLALDRVGSKKAKVRCGETRFRSERLKLVGEGGRLDLLGCSIAASTEATTRSWREFNKELTETLAKCVSAPLSIDRKLGMIRTYVIPKYTYRLSLMNQTKNPNRVQRSKYAEALDRSVDSMLRNILHVANGVRHKGSIRVARLPISEGGLGFSNLENQYWRSRKTFAKNIEALLGSAAMQVLCPDRQLAHLQAIESSQFRSDQLNAWRMLAGNGWSFQGMKVIDAFRSKTNPTGLSGGKQVRFYHMRSNLLRTNANRFMKRQSNSAKCRHCGAASESVTHLLGSCQCQIAKTHYINRHDRVAKRIARMAEKQKLTIVREHAVIGGEGQRLRPDLIISNEKCSFIVEVGVTTEVKDHSALGDRFEVKFNKYNHEWLKAALKESGTVPIGNQILVVPIIVGSRGTYLKKIPRQIQKFAQALGVSGKKLLSCASQTAAEMSLLTLDKLLR